MKRYECCKSDENNAHISGCEDKYDCCNKLKTAVGCTKVNLQSELWYIGIKWNTFKIKLSKICIELFILWF